MELPHNQTETFNGGAPETKEEAFARLMERRVTEARKYIRLCGNLSSRAMYRYSDEQVKLAFDAVREALAEAESRFRVAGPKQRDMFRY